MPLPRIALERINVHLDGRHVLKELSWRLEAGDHWAFVGKNGSGKSTLLRVIRGDLWIDRDGGRRSYSPDGSASESVAAAAGWIAYVAPEQQERYIRLDLPLRGRAIVESGVDDTLYVHRALEPAASERVEGIIDRFGLRPIVEKRIRALSFGQLRRLLIARALVRNPRVLVLDEFTHGLDRAARADVLAFLEQLADSVQLLLASHRAGDFVPAVTHVATLEGGRIVDVGAGIPVRTRRTAPRSEPAARPLERGATAVEPLVSIRHADVYRGETRVLHDVTWEIRRGEHTAIHGQNGSGKSTFAGLVAGTIHAAFGARVRRFGSDGPFDLWELKERIAHVSDELQIAYDVNDTVEEVILSGFASSIGLFHEPEATERRTAAQIVRRLGLEALRGRRFLRLSFGERRKVLIARSLVRPPELFILDEVWNGLDADFRVALAALLETLAAQGTTLLLIAHHDDDVPPLIQRTFTIEGGRLLPSASFGASADRA